MAGGPGGTQSTRNSESIIRIDPCVTFFARRIAEVRSMLYRPESNQTVTCPCCHQEMMFVRSIPKLGVLPELQTFFCPFCGETETQEVTLAA